MEYVVLGLGSNKKFEGMSSIQILSKACASLNSIIEGCVFSSVYKTGAMYVTEQDDFYNMVALGFYKGEPHELLDEIHLIENKFGRDRSFEIRNGPRPLDIDIELFGKRVVNDADLIIPHAKIAERSFVLTPLVEVLKKYADVKIRNCIPAQILTEYEVKLMNIKNQKIEKFLDSKDFIKLLG